MSVIISKSHSLLYDRLFHLFLLVIGISIGLVFTLTLQPNFFVTLSTSKLPPPLHEPPLLPPPPPPPPLPPLQENTTHDPATVNVLLSNNWTYSVMHNMSDDELFWRASNVHTNVDNASAPKVAFMFLTPGPLPLAPLWDRFFNGNEGMFSIYIHTHPSYNESMPVDSSFHGRRIPSQPVYWGTMSMIDAERRLIANALLDSSNQRFVLLSDSCIPVFNFTTIYNYLMGTNYSFLGSFDDPRIMGRGRYNRKMWPMITIEQWRKGSQWFEIHRQLAAAIVSDQKYYQLFLEFCHKPCYNDEHYLPTLVNILFPGMNSNRSITWVHWPRDGPHPSKYGWIDVKVELLNQVRFGSECTYNGNKTNVCHLFGRKFLPSSLRVLLKFASSVLGI